MTHPRGDPSKIAAGAPASRLSPTEANRIACWRAWRHRVWRYQAEYVRRDVHPLFVLARKACGGEAVANSARATGKPAADEEGDTGQQYA
jgi:hypothetical protein